MRAYNGFVHIGQDFYTSLRFGTTASVAYSGLTPFATGSFSVSFWIYTKSFSAAQTILSGSAGAPEITITTSGAVTLGPNGSAVICASVGALSINEWRHITVTYNAGNTTSKIYFDGEDVGASSTAGTFTNYTTATSSMSDGTFIANLCIYNTVVDQGGVRAEFYNYPAPFAPLHRFRCNDATGTTLADSNGSASGTATNCTFAPYNIPKAPVITQNPDAGYVLLDGTGDYIATTANLFHTAFNGEQKLMLSCWVRLAKDATYCYPIAVTAGGTTHARMEIDKTQTQGTFKSTGADSAQTSSIILANSSQHKWLDASQIWVLNTVVCDFSAGVIEHYVNGVKFARVTGATFGSTTLNYASTNVLAIGSAAAAVSPIKGAIGPTYICAGNITQQMVRDLYLTGAVPNVNKVAYWLMEDGSGTAVTQRGNVANFSATLQGDAIFGVGGIS